VSLALTWPHRLCLLRVLLGATATVTSLPICKHTGGGGATPVFSGWLVYLQISRKCPFPAFQWNPPLDTATSFPAPRLLGMCCHSCLLQLACLFTVPWEIAPPPLFRAQGTPPSLLHVFLLLLLFIIQFFFSFFPGWGSICPGAMLIWPRVVCGSTMCCLAHLVVCFSRAGRSWCLVAQKPSWAVYPACLPWHRDAMHRLGVWWCQSFTSSWWFFLQGLSPASLQDFTLVSMLSASSL
jgi:hypothetical protein